MSLGKSLLVGLVLGSLIAALFCHMALDNNNQGEFADVTTGSYTSNLYVLFVVTVSVIGLPIAVLLRLAKPPEQPDD
jgi:hypothetical protein